MYRSCQGKENLSMAYQKTCSHAKHRYPEWPQWKWSYFTPTPFNIFLLNPTSLLWQKTPSHLHCSRGLGKDWSSMNCCWVFKLWVFWGYTSLQYLGLLQRGMWMQKTSGPGASQHSHGSSTTRWWPPSASLWAAGALDLQRFNEVSSGSGFFWQIQTKTKGLALSQCHLEA